MAIVPLAELLKQPQGFQAAPPAFRHAAKQIRWYMKPQPRSYLRTVNSQGGILGGRSVGNCAQISDRGVLGVSRQAN